MAGNGQHTPRPDFDAKLRFALVILVLGTAWFGPVTEAAETLLSGHPWSWADALLRGALFGAAMAVIFTVLLWPQGEFGRRLAVRRSTSERQLPAAADAAGWGSVLHREHGRLRVALWAAPLCFATEAVLVAAVAMRTAGASSGLWLLAATSAVVAAAVPVRTQRRLRTVERFETELASLPSD